ncbi:MAG: methyltransferase domain-containing protein [archaeon]|jgi:SAM-dependent methyltransferase
MSQYDLIGKSYSDMIRVDPVKIFVQRPSAIKLLGIIKDKKILDIGCGDGIISRMIAQNGAKVIGIDPSEKQIFVAQNEEQKNPLGINYSVSTLQNFSSQDKFDSALAVMVLCYGENKKELQSFFDLVFSLLKERGRFSIIDFDKAVFPKIKNYYGRSFSSNSNGKVTITWDIKGVEKYSTEVNYFLKSDFEECAKKAGFKNIVFSNLSPTKEGILKMGEKYWEQFEKEPVWFGLTMEK